MGHPRSQALSRRLSPKISGYTLIELAITMAIILILSTIGLFFYQSALAYARGTVCQTNIKAIKTAVEEYVFENDALPATLGQIDLKHFEKGYARALKGGSWKFKFSLFLIELDQTGRAHAQFLTPENLKKYGAVQDVFHCPADDDGSPSYGINASVQGKRWSEIDQNEIIVADSDHYVFTFPDQLSKRHRKKAHVIRKNGQILKMADAADADAADVIIDDSVPESTDADDTDTDDDEVTICHKPGKAAQKTMTIPNSALSGHLGHGDTIGECASGR